MERASLLPTTAVDGMSNFYVKLYNRSFNAVLALPEIRVIPRRWGAMATGGPEYALLDVYGPEAALWQALDWLRYGVEIYNDLGVAVWWGYVESANLETSSVSVSVSLDDLANSVKVEYGEGATAFTEDADSIASYGRKQRVLSVDSALANSASERGNVELGYSSQPRAIQDIRRNEGAQLVLSCVGWLKTLGWLYYSRADGLLEYVGTGAKDQVFGLGVSDDEFWFVAEGREIHDTGLNLYKFERGQKLAVSGSSSNNTTYTVARPTTTGPAGVTISNQLNFLASNKTIYRYGSTSPAELAWIMPGDRIHITGTTYNNGWYQVTGVSPTWADMWITVAESITNELPTNPVLWRGHSIGLEEQPTEEKPGATVTLVVDGSKIAQRFTPDTSWSAYSVWLKLNKVGAPGDSVQVSIYSDSSGSPGSSLGSVGVAAAGVSANSAWTSFTLSTPIALTGGAYYWIVVERTGSVDASNYYAVSLDEDAGYGDGYSRLWTGAAWVARSTEADLLFRLEGQEATTTQISQIVTDAGQFLTGTVLEDTSGINTNQYRQGAVDALTELTDLLAIGTTNARRLLCQVRQDRKLRVWEEPAYAGTPGYVRRLNGEIVGVGGVPLQAGELAAGQWMRIETPLRTAGGLAADPTLLFVERMEYDADRNEYTVTPRGAPNIWRLAAIPRA